MKHVFSIGHKAIYKVIIIFYVTHNSAAEVESFHLFILLPDLQQVQTVRPYLIPPPDAPERGLRQALLTATSPCQFPGTSLKVDTNAIHLLFGHVWPPRSLSFRDAPFLLHPFIPAVNVRTTWCDFLVT
jgi:hypothetical protein